ncbi:MAG: YlbF family regulator [Candidatus Nanoarchaeia archaeon]
MENKEIKNKTKEFAQEILKSKEYRYFLSNLKTLRENEKASNLLEEFQRKQRDLQRKEDDSELRDELQKLQVKIKNDETIMTFLRAQDELVNLLRRTNDIISEKIGMPFTSSLGGCCG